MARIILDAGHGGTTDPGAVYQGRQEKNDNLRLALAVGQLLEEQGIDVVYTRTEDIYQRPLEKAQIANAAGGDLFLSFHRNSSPSANQYTGAEVLIYNDSGDKAALARTIGEKLEQAGFRNLGISERPGLIVLRRTQMPSVLIETGFINNEEDNERFDKNFDTIARSIADAILTFPGLSRPETLYRVQTGSFRNRNYAQAMLMELLASRFPAYILQENDYFRVQVGAFRNLSNAAAMETALRKKGYSTFIVS